MSQPVIALPGYSLTREDLRSRDRCLPTLKEKTGDKGWGDEGHDKEHKVCQSWESERWESEREIVGAIEAMCNVHPLLRYNTLSIIKLI